MSRKNPLSSDPAAARQTVLAEIVRLRQQLRVAIAECDRNASEKLDAIARAEAAAKECEEMRALLHDVTAQRDNLLTQYETSALQTDEATREVYEAIFFAGESEKKAEESNHHAQELAERIEALTRALDEERRAATQAAADYAAYRQLVESAPAEDPRVMLRRAIAQLTCDGVAWTRSKIPVPAQPWFDLTVKTVAKAARLALQLLEAFIRWARPRAVECYSWIKGEILLRLDKK